MRIVLLCALLLQALPTFSFDFSQNQLGWPGKRLDGVPCRGKGGGYGPFDYTDPKNQGETLNRVYRAHFTPQVEHLIHGQSGTILADLDYTLRAIPNQHQALYAVIRLSFLGRRDYRGMLSYSHTSPTPPECYLQRAIKYRPKDGQVKVLYGIYLYKRKRFKSAFRMFNAAIKLMPDSSEAYYNRGLTLVRLKRYDLAKDDATRAYDLGFPLDGLRNKLKKLGYWK